MGISQLGRKAGVESVWIRSHEIECLRLSGKGAEEIG